MIIFLHRSFYDDRHAEGKRDQCFAHDNYWWLDKLGIFRILNK